MKTANGLKFVVVVLMKIIIIPLLILSILFKVIGWLFSFLVHFFPWAFLRSFFSKFVPYVDFVRKNLL